MRNVCQALMKIEVGDDEYSEMTKPFYSCYLEESCMNITNCIQTKKICSTRISEIKLLAIKLQRQKLKNIIYLGSVSAISVFASGNTLSKYTGNALYRNLETKEAVTRLQSQGCLPSYKAAFQLRFAKRVFYFCYKNFFKKLFLRPS